MKLPLFMLGLCWGSAALAENCKTIEAGQTVKAACFRIIVGQNEAALLSVEQPVDLEIRIDSQTIFDGFNFGRETATLTAAGEYRIEVRAISENNPHSAEFLMSRAPLPLHAALIRREAEERATFAKRYGNTEDLAVALESWQKTGDLSAIGRLRLDQGDIALAAARPLEARSNYEEALTACRSAADRRCMAEAMNSSGLASQQLVDFEQARTRLTEAVEEFHHIRERMSEGQALSNLGLLLRQAGDYQGAISDYGRARAILRSRDAVANARVLNNLGVCYQALMQYDLAQNYLETALAVFRTHRVARETARARLNLGRNFMLQDNLALALRTLGVALAEATAAQDRATRADALLNLGEALIKSHSKQSAEARLDQALALHRAAGDRRRVATDLHYLGVVAGARGNFAAAREKFNEALEIRLSCGLRDAAVDSLYALADLERTTGNRDGARHLSERALDILEAVRSRVPGAALRASFYARRRQLFDQLVDLENAKSPGDGLLAAERSRGRALMDLLAEGSLLRQVPADLKERRLALQKQMDLLALRLSTAPDDRVPELRRQVELLAGEDEEIQSRIQQTIAWRPLGYKLASIDDLQRKLPGQSALIEYHLGENQSYLWFVDKSTLQLHLLPKRADIDAKCAQTLELFHDILGRKRSAEKQQRFERVLRELSLTLAGPLRNTPLPPRIIVIADGGLTQFPFAALEFAANESLGLEHDVVQLPSAAFLGAGRKPTNLTEFPRTILAVSDPVYSTKDPRVRIKLASIGQTQGPALARLPFTAEIAALETMIPISQRCVLRGFDANVSEVENSHLEDYALVHFSTHALIDDRLPELSRIALSMVDAAGRPVDGFLRPYQLSRLPLQGSTVILSACDTALGKQVLGEGLMGFTASLFSAGAARLVLTLSAIDAEGSSEFWVKAYRSMFGEPRANLEHAVTLARRNLAHSARWSDPYYWASYVVYGLPSEHL
jgi:CHAT domain-containing protein/Tfp pilus assembly protein PilF